MKKIYNLKCNSSSFSPSLRLYSVITDKDGVEFSFEKSGNLPGYLLAPRKGRLILTGQKVGRSCKSFTEFVLIVNKCKMILCLFYVVGYFCKLKTERPMSDNNYGVSFHT